MTPVRLIAVTSALGAGHALSFAPWPAWWGQLLTMGLALHLLRQTADTSPRVHALAAFGFGFGHFVAGLCWLHVSMHRYGGMPWLLAALAVIAFAAYLALYPTLSLLVARRLGGARGPEDDWRADLTACATLAACWALGEIARGWVLTGFPWLSHGYAHVDGPLGGLAPWVGVYGVGAAAIWVAAWLALAIVRSPRRPLRLVIALLSLLVPWLLGQVAFTRADGPAVEVRLVQGNVPQQLKFDPRRTLEAMERYTRWVEQSRARLTVLPETAWTSPWASTPDGIRERLRSHLARSDGRLALGLPMLRQESGASRFTNSVLLLDGGPESAGREPRYDKHHLVPFGEFIPWGFAWFVQLMNIPLGSFADGALDQPAFVVAGQRFAFNICYEDLFGEELAVAVREPVSAGVLVNVSNLAWFGDSHALTQHREIARMRVLETGRPMLRATNTGVTASIDASARVVAALPTNTEGVLDVSVQATTGLTPYVRAGNLPVLAAAALIVLAAWRRARRRARIQ